MELPAQAIPARLTNLCPSGDKWSLQAIKCFAQLVAHRIVMARITSVSHLVSVCLCDTSGEDDVHVNDVLMTSGLALRLRDELVSWLASRCVNYLWIMLSILFFLISIYRSYAVSVKD